MKKNKNLHLKMYINMMSARKKGIVNRTVKFAIWNIMFSAISFELIPIVWNTILMPVELKTVLDF